MTFMALVLVLLAYRRK